MKLVKNYNFWPFFCEFPSNIRFNFDIYSLIQILQEANLYYRELLQKAYLYNTA